ncbi:MAG TPA: gephyrin-like molybdotransferase Glp [Candidatus Limnocylindrales bacterium]
MTTDRLLTVEEARDRVFAAIAGPTPSEVAWLSEALGRVAAERVTSPIALPPWDNSAMDGYAIRAGDTSAASDEAPVNLEVIGEVRAGQPPNTEVRHGTAVRIATGAPVPPKADAVIPVEQTTRLDATGAPTGERGRDATGPLPARIAAHAPITPGGSIRRKGSDLAAGTAIIEPGTVLTPAVIALAAGVGLELVKVHRRPHVSVLATGDEVRGRGADLGAAGIPDANGPALMAMVEAAGGHPDTLGIAKDTFDDVRQRICAGLVGGADVIIVSGGVSVGPYDVVRNAFAEFGEIDLWRVAVQPGKPFAFGTARAPGDDGSDPSRPPTLLFGLPGNPVSTFVTFELFVRPALRRLAGFRDDDLYRPVDRAVLADDVSKSHGRRGFIRVRVDRDDRGTPRRDERGHVTAYLAGGAGGQGSHVMSALATADALAVIPEADDTLPAGAEVELWWLDRS